MRKWMQSFVVAVALLGIVGLGGLSSELCEYFAGADGILSQEEFDQAVTYWQSQEILPGSDDTRVTSEDLLNLLGLMTSGETCGAPTATIPDTTEVLGETELSAIVDMTGDGEMITYEPLGALSNVEIGDVIAAPVSQATPHGLFRKVTSKALTRDGNVVVTTESATLTDAIKSGDLMFSKHFTPQDLSAPITLPNGITMESRSGEFVFNFDAFEIDDVGVKVSGSFEFDPHVNFVVGIRRAELVYAECSLDVDQRIELSLTCELTVERGAQVKIHEFDLGWFTVWIGFVPVPIHVTVPLVVGARGEISAGLTTTVWEETTVREGLRFDKDATPQWSPIAEITFSSGFDPLVPSIGGTVTGFVGPHLQFLIGGLFGPYISLHGFAQLDVDFLRDPVWILYGGAEGGVGFRFEFLGQQMADYSDPDVIVYRITLAQGGQQTGFLSGTVKDAVTWNPIPGVQVKVFSSAFSDELVVNGATDDEGLYKIEVPVGDDYRVEFQHPGYISETYYGVDIQEGQTSHLATVLQVDEEHNSPGSVAGTVRNALTGAGVGGLIVDLRRGINVTEGSVDYTTTTQGDGSYTIADVDAGSYTATAHGDGYNDVVFSVVCIGGTTTDNQDASITPVLPENEIRIVLTWGATPRDLDSHLTGPLDDGGRFHIAYYHKGSENGPERAQLDRDDTTSYGPETTTIYKVRTGTYRYSVHDYTNRWSSNSLALSNSGAMIQVYAGSGLVATFNVPAGQEGTLWTVFEIQDGNIVPINNMSYESDPGNVRSIEKEER